MIGTVVIKELKINCIVGVYPRERVKMQDLFMDLELDLDFDMAAQSDQIGHTVDYTQVVELLESWTKEEKFKLIETLAVGACRLILARWPAIRRCKIEVKKPGALTQAKYASVAVERQASP